MPVGCDSPTASALDPAAEHAVFVGDAVRTLREVRLTPGAVRSAEGQSGVLAVVDVETTGLCAQNDQIIELAIRRFRYDEKGTIVEIGQGYSWLEEPSVPVAADVSKLTGLTDADLLGTRIDDVTAVSILKSADWIAAHNARFDRPFVEARLPLAAGKPWCCTCVDIDWRARGFDGRALGHLLSQAGLCHAGHRALNDVDAVIALLEVAGGERSAVAELFDSASSPIWLISAVGASFGVKDELRRRGYRWNADLRAWQREIPDRDLMAEQFWLARAVYSADANPQAFEPRVERADPTSRFL